jgi:glycosyltransferase involved in cell wall biosynthesis
MAPVAAFVSFRLGGADGVSVEARKWAWAFEQLGFATRRIAGEIEDEPRPGDVVLPWLGIDATDVEPDVAALAGALTDADLVVAENLCSLPLNPTASRLTARVLAGLGTRVVFHHHDLPWQRRAFSHASNEFPPRLAGAAHVTVNQRSRRELEARGYADAVVVQNRFDFDTPPGDRVAARAQFGFTDDELVVFQPSRAIERKNVPGGIRFAAGLERVYPEQPVRYWLSGPAEDGYGPTLERVLARATVPVTLGRAATSVDAYAASDLVVMPSTWEGFGNPTIESIVARRPLAAFAYPVLSEILATGLRFFSTGDAAAIARFLREPDAVRQRFYDVNLRRARLSYDLAELPKDLARMFAERGWRW